MSTKNVNEGIIVAGENSRKFKGNNIPINYDSVDKIASDIKKQHECFNNGNDRDYKEKIKMARLNKTEKNLQKVWDDLDKAYEHLEFAIYDISRMTDIPEGIKQSIKALDITAIPVIKEQIELLIENK
ncbi:hypothetical protein [Anaerovorax sp. IOR16]|uniref:hypothetical protein n=1 Tax=Anaerovorax sp. IOR16 TaxID=2773458 RepID=UPI0019D1F712|nr:hypothetical protein [Anaerovorax sp. IOR16]